MSMFYLRYDFLAVRDFGKIHNLNTTKLQMGISNRVMKLNNEINVKVYENASDDDFVAIF